MQQPSSRYDTPEPVAGAVNQTGLRVYLLGDFRVLARNRELREDSWRLRKASVLVKLLALAPDHSLHREQVMEQLWPERPTGAAANNLRVTLHSVRRVLDVTGSGSPALLLQGDRLTLECVHGIWVDVWAFEEAARSCADNPDIYPAALDLYAGDLLPNDPYEAWLTNRREALRQTHVSLLMRLARLREERGELELAIEALRRVVVDDPTHEDAHTGLMSLHALTGNRPQALRQFGHLQDALQRELDVEPDPASRELYDAILANRFPGESGCQTLWSASDVRVRAQRPAVEDRPARQSNLPAEISSFIGRTREIAQMRQALRQHRLVTLTGAGGSGKTRLALRVASTMIDEHVDGVWLVELAGVTDPALVAHTVASTLGIPEDPRQPASDVLAGALEDRRLLLVLDNCEHLVEACALLAETLLAHCPELRILATSRETLRLPGEAARRVPPLPVPDPGSGAAVDANDAVRLFVDRARLVQSNFTMSASNADAIAAICIRLDGLPLAIELAAARMRALSVEQIAGRLDDAPGLLTGGARTASPRQQTLWASMEWSYALLGPQEQTLLQRLSVFAGGCTLEAVEVVCAGEGILPEAVLDLLFHLVDKSLVVVEEQDGEVRYRLLEPIRQYAAQWLEEGGDAGAIFKRHFSWCLELAEQSEVELRDSEQQEWLSRLEREHDNLRAALNWADVSGEDGEGLRLATPLSRFWFTGGYLIEGRRWLTTFLDRGRTSDAGMEYGRALFSVGRLAYAARDIAAARQFFSEALDIARKENDGTYIAGALTQLGFVASRQNDYSTARQHLEAAVMKRRELGQEWYLAVARVGLGRVALAQGQYREAHAVFDESLAFFQGHGDKVQAGDCLIALAQLAQAQNDLELARGLYEESLVLLHSVGHGRLIANTLVALGRLARDQGHTEQTRALFAQSLEIYHELGIRQSVDDCLQELAELG